MPAGARNAASVGELVMIEIADDGRGVDVDAVKRRAQAIGLDIGDGELEGHALLEVLSWGVDLPSREAQLTERVVEPGGRGRGGGRQLEVAVPGVHRHLRGDGEEVPLVRDAGSAGGSEGQLRCALFAARVMQDEADVGPAEPLLGTEGEEFGVPGSRADDRDEADHVRTRISATRASRGSRATRPYAGVA